MSHNELRNRKQNKRKSNSNKKKGSSSQKQSNKKPKSAHTLNSKQWSAWPSSFMLLIILSLIVYNGLQYNIPSITGSISNRKPYKTVEDFYPYYLNEHSHPNDQRAHIFGSTLIVLIALVKPEIAITTMIGILSGYIIFP
eukprot:869425_1